ncbi:MAG: hypothetical protein AB7J40_03455 [Candidatus Altimarinota bacterium]
MPLEYSLGNKDASSSPEERRHPTTSERLRQVLHQVSDAIEILFPEDAQVLKRIADTPFLLSLRQPMVQRIVLQLEQHPSERLQSLGRALRESVDRYKREPSPSVIAHEDPQAHEEMTANNPLRVRLMKASNVLRATDVELADLLYDLSKPRSPELLADSRDDIQRALQQLRALEHVDLATDLEESMIATCPVQIEPPRTPRKGSDETRRLRRRTSDARQKVQRVLGAKRRSRQSSLQGWEGFIAAGTFSALVMAGIISQHRNTSAQHVPYAVSPSAKTPQAPRRVDISPHHSPSLASRLSPDQLSAYRPPKINPSLPIEPELKEPPEPRREIAHETLQQAQRLLEKAEQRIEALYHCGDEYEKAYELLSNKRLSPLSQDLSLKEHRAFLHELEAVVSEGWIRQYEHPLAEGLQLHRTAGSSSEWISRFESAKTNVAFIMDVSLAYHELLSGVSQARPGVPYIDAQPIYEKTWKGFVVDLEHWKLESLDTDTCLIHPALAKTYEKLSQLTPYAVHGTPEQKSLLFRLWGEVALQEARVDAPLIKSARQLDTALLQVIRKNFTTTPFFNYYGRPKGSYLHEEVSPLFGYLRAFYDSQDMIHRVYYRFLNDRR